MRSRRASERLDSALRSCAAAAARSGRFASASSTSESGSATPTRPARPRVERVVHFQDRWGAAHCQEIGELRARRFELLRRRVDRLLRLELRGLRAGQVCLEASPRVAAPPPASRSCRGCRRSPRRRRAARGQHGHGVLLLHERQQCVRRRSATARRRRGLPRHVDAEPALPDERSASSPCPHARRHQRRRASGTPRGS